jgi:hypothetical protein
MSETRHEQFPFPSLDLSSFFFNVSSCGHHWWSPSYTASLEERLQHLRLCLFVLGWVVKVTLDVPYKLVYKSPLRYKPPRLIGPPSAEGRRPGLTKFVWRTDHLHSNSPIRYKPPALRGHLTRTGHIGGAYMLVYTVNNVEMVDDGNDLISERSRKAASRS